VAKKKKPHLLLLRPPPLHPLPLLTLLLPPPHRLLPTLRLLLPHRPLPLLLTRSNRFFDHVKATFGWLFSCLQLL